MGNELNSFQIIDIHKQNSHNVVMQTHNSLLASDVALLANWPRLQLYLNSTAYDDLWPKPLEALGSVSSYAMRNAASWDKETEEERSLRDPFCWSSVSNLPGIQTRNDSGLPPTSLLLSHSFGGVSRKRRPDICIYEELNVRLSF